MFLLINIVIIALILLTIVGFLIQQIANTAVPYRAKVVPITVKNNRHHRQ